MLVTYIQVDLSRVWVLVHSAWLSHSTMPRLLLPRYEEVSSLFNNLPSHSASWFLSGSIMVSHLIHKHQPLKQRYMGKVQTSLVDLVQVNVKLPGGCLSLCNLSLLSFLELEYCSCHSHLGEYFIHWGWNDAYDRSTHRWLVNQGRDDEALAILSKARGLSVDADLIRLEFLYVWGIPSSVWRDLMAFFREIRAQHLFEKEVSEQKFPDYQDGSWSSSFRLGLYGYLSLIREKRERIVLDFKRLSYMGLRFIVSSCCRIFVSVGLLSGQEDI